jgi:hypothetical protein
VSDAESNSSLEREKFAQLFGVTEDQLIARGIDPGEYARDNVKEALKDKSKWNLVLSKSTQYTVLWTRWGYRAVVAMFVGIGSLALATLSSIRWLGVALACISGGYALTSIFLLFRYRRLYRSACIEEGITPSWKLRRVE